MRSSTLLAVACAGLAAASPLLNKKAIEYDIVTDVIVVTITAGLWGAQPTVVTEAASTSVEAATTEVQVVSTTAAAAMVSIAASVDVSIAASPTAAVAATTTEAASSDASPTDYSSTATYHHNIHRANHSAPGLTYNSTLAGFAATLAAGCVFEHNLDIGGGGYGQNIASVGSTDADTYTDMQMLADATTNMWYNGEVGEYLESYYGEANPDFSNFDAWGHFSQLVWKASTTVGCATQKCAAGTMYSSMESWFTVCNYGPEGNMGGEYGDNVLPPLGEATISF